METPDTASHPHTLAGAVRRAALMRPDHPALITPGPDEDIRTWAEVDAAVDAAARALLALAGPRTGAHPPRVAIALPNGADFAVTLFGAMRAGLVAVPVNPGYTEPEMRHVLTDAGASVLVGRTLDLPGLTCVPADLPAGGDRPLPAVDAHDLAVLLYTSGTEGRPKGAMLTHAALVANHEQLAGLGVVDQRSVVLLAVPMFHAYGLNSGLGSVAYHGACGVVVAEFDAAATLAAVERHRVSVLVGVPSMYAAWLAQPGVAGRLATVEEAVCGAAPLDPDVLSRWHAETHTAIRIGYGLTETAPVLTATDPSPDAKPGSIGRAVPGVELVLRAPDATTDDYDVDPGDPAGTEPGEIVVRGANLFSGYWPDGRGGPDADGWWGTGDIALADADGELFLVDRVGELIIVNGFNVYPREVERVLEEHPAVREAAAVGVPSAATGQAVRAFVVLSGPADDLAEHCAARLARYKRPDRIEVVDELPHSAIGKVRKTELRDAT
ncbi:AMP-binding protein [Spirilliplanes yamanashiensis]|uniref:AMP-binding protein n=1 Tax=Spirilliplanes yamanashiensis TaxID=42233 RepID=UPI0023B2A478|nr:AMP-binding protein [Spirilliplanes yamanashiensis]MDP9814318.1 long-chain acyl-CoA synthetase [Spirilliplanes yamanashiensis]